MVEVYGNTIVLQLYYNSILEYLTRLDIFTQVSNKMKNMKQNDEHKYPVKSYRLSKKNQDRIKSKAKLYNVSINKLFTYLLDLDDEEHAKKIIYPQ